MAGKLLGLLLTVGLACLIMGVVALGSIWLATPGDPELASAAWGKLLLAVLATLLEQRFLRRTASGAFGIEEAATWPVPAGSPLLSLALVARRSLPVLHLTVEGEHRARLGQRLGSDHFREQPAEGGHARVMAWLNDDDELIALGRRAEDSFRVVRGFNAT